MAPQKRARTSAQPAAPVDEYDAFRGLGALHDVHKLEESDLQPFLVKDLNVLLPAAREAGWRVSAREAFSKSLEKACPKLAELLRRVDWPGGYRLVLAGGAVLRFLDGEVDLAAFSSSDFDIFVVGLLRSAEINRQMLEAVLEALSGLAPRGTPVKIERTPNCVQLSLGGNEVQLILCISLSVSRLLEGFDKDCIALAYDGTNVLAIPRAVRALYSRINVACAGRRSM